MVSTDDQEIAAIAIQYGAKVPFMRSTKNTDDYAGTVDVIIEVQHDYAKSGVSFTHACCIYPTAPLIQNKNISHAFDVLVIQKN